MCCALGGMGVFEGAAMPGAAALGRRVWRGFGTGLLRVESGRSVVWRDGCGWRGWGIDGGGEMEGL
jgi:hypothetical protein